MSPGRRRPEPSRLEPGAQLGPYRIISSLGAGGMGEVWKARDERLKRDVAVKVLPPAFAADGDRLRRFAEEARAAGGLNHPGILAVHDLGEHEEVPYLVTELLEGQTLRERMSEGRVAPRKAIDLAAQIAHALAAAHEKGIIHRDLKPENLFVLHDGRVKILDFGLAKAMATEPDGDAEPPVDAGAATAVASTQSGAVVGTPGYMAPEQARGDLGIDARADIFAIGTVLYEMLAGKPAFPGESAVERSFAVLKHDPAPLPDRTPPALDLLIRRCLEKKPAERFQSARDLGFSLQAMSNVSTTAAVPVLSSERSRRWPLWAAGLALLGGVGVAGFAVGRGGAPVVVAPSSPAYQKLIFRNGVVNRARFTADGRAVIFAGDFEGEPAKVYMTAPGQGRARSLSDPGVGLFDVSSKGEMALSVRRRVLAVAPLAGGQPREKTESVTDASWSPDGARLAVAQRSNLRSTLEYPEGTLLHETAEAIEMVRVAPSGDRVAWVNKPVRREGRGRVWVGGGGQEARPIGPEWASIEGLAWGPGGRELWVSAGESESRRVLRAIAVDGGAERLLLRLPGVFRLEDVAADGRALIVWSNEHPQIIGFAPGEPERDLGWSNEDLLAGMTPDGNKVLLVDASSGSEIKTYLRGSDGAPAVEVATGRGWAVSNDAKWVLLSRRAPWKEIVLVPTGPGAAQPQPAGEIVEITGAAFTSDPRRWVVAGPVAGGKPRLWLQQAGQPPRALAAEGMILVSPVSPDDTFVIGRSGTDGKLARVPLDGGEATMLEGLEPWRTTVTGFTDDGKLAYTVRRLDEGVVLERYDFAAAKASPHEPDAALANRALTFAILARDGKRGVATTGVRGSELYLVTGID